MRQLAETGMPYATMPFAQHKRSRVSKKRKAFAPTLPSSAPGPTDPTGDSPLLQSRYHAGLFSTFTRGVWYGTGGATVTRVADLVVTMVQATQESSTQVQLEGYYALRVSRHA